MTPIRLLVLSFGGAIGVLFPFVPIVLGSFGFTPGEIGVITALAALASAIAVPTWGHLADVRLGRPRALQSCVVGASAAALALLVHWPPFLVVVLVVVLYLFVSSYQPLVDALTVNTVRGRSGYARVRLLSSFSFAVAAVVAGFLYDRTGYWLVFVLFAALSGFLALAATLLPDVGRANLAAHVAATEARKVAAAATRGAAASGPAATIGHANAAAPALVARQRFGSAGVALRVAPRLGLILVAIGVMHVSLISSYTFIGLRIVQLGGHPSDIALAAGVSAGVEVPTMFFASAVASRIGLRTMFAVGAALYASVFLLWTVTDSPSVIIVSRVVTGFAFTGVVVSIVLTIATLLPPDLQATGQALFQTTANGVGAVFANLLGGALYQGLGPSAVFLVAGALAIAAATLGFLVFPARTSRAPVR